MTINAQSSDSDSTGHPKSALRRRFALNRAVIAPAALLCLVAALYWWHSQRPETCYRRGRRALRAGDWQTVLRESRRLRATPEYEPQGRLLYGLYLAECGRPDEALPHLQRAAQGRAVAVEALTAIAENQYRLGRYLDSIEAAREALSHNGATLDARRWLAAAYYDLGAIDHAVEELTRISADAPEDARPERLLGLIHLDLEEFSRAAEHLRETLRRDPRQPEREEVLGELADSLVKLSRFDEALASLQDTEPTAKTLTLAAECEQGMGRTDAAQKLLGDALERDPHYVPAYLRLGALMLFLGNVDAAVRAAETAVELSPFSSVAHFQLSQAYLKQGESAKAAEQLQLMAEASRLETEFSALHAAAAREPTNADVRYRTGVLAQKLGKPELARIWLQAALSIEPDHDEARAAMSHLEQALSGR